MTSIGGRERLAAIVPPTPDTWSLANGLRVVHLPVAGARVVTTALCYLVGTVHEDVEQAGIAHLLEHMMFKGSERYGPGDVDRRTHVLGGESNAYTSHDATVYYFDFGEDHWFEAMAIEADRMRGLTLDSREVESERRVVLEEISMYLDDPWDALEQEVNERLYGAHPYGRPILGSRTTLASLDEDALRAFHEAHYRPGNAVLAVVGAVERAAVEECVSEHFGDILDRRPQAAAQIHPGDRLDRESRLERRKGETARLLLSMPGLAAGDPDLAAVATALTLLAGGRTSRLQRRLVEDLELCSQISADFTECVDPGAVSISAEVMPGVEPERVEEEIRRELDVLARAVPSRDEIERARSILAAEWVFGHQRTHQLALTILAEEALFGAGYSRRWLEALRECSASRLAVAAGRHLCPEQGAVVGWSLAERSGRIARGSTRGGGGAGA